MSSMQPPPGVGGFLFNGKPLWHPPISVSWILTIVLLVISANSEEISPEIRKLILHPIGFFVTVLCGIMSYDYGYPHVCFALLFFLLMVWSISKRKEGFSPSGTLDWVTNNKRWFSEVVLKEKPIAIQEKDVTTYPVQGS